MADPSPRLTSSLAELDARSRDIFRELVEAYLDTGEPVGSRTLSKRGGLNLSPASIRNTLADLAGAGLLSAPHTSAGRMPTHALFGRPRQDSARPVGAIGFSAVRGGGAVGEHSALFLGAFEELEIRHRANDRFVFARGAVEAGQWLTHQKPGFYGIEDVLGFGR